MMLSVGFVAVAQDTAVTPVSSVRTAQPMVLEIGPAGRTLLRGTVVAVGTNSLTVKSWGGDWVVNVSASTKLAPRTDIAQFAVGDFVGVNGTVSQSAAWTIDATLVKNWTERKEIKGEVKEKKQEIRQEKKNESPQDVQKKIDAILEQIKKIQAQMSSGTY